MMTRSGTNVILTLKRELIMKKLFYILFVGALVLSSCANEDGPGIVKTEKVTIGAVAGDMVDADTRTGLYDGIGMHWFDGEQVGVYRRAGNSGNRIMNGGISTPFTVQANASFPSKSAKLIGEFAEDNTKVPTYYVAVYPHDGNSQFADYFQNINLALPATQYYVNNNGVAGVRGIPMIARGRVEDNTLTFHPMYALLRLRVKLNAAATAPVIVKNVKVTVNSSTEYLSGRGTVYGVDFIDETTLGPSFRIGWSTTSLEDKVLTLDCGDGVELNKNEETILYIAVPSPNGATIQGGYKFEFIGDDVTLAASTKTTAITIRTGELYNLPLVELSVPVVNTGIEMPDANLRSYLVGLGAATDLGDGTIEVINPNLDVITLPTTVMSLEGLEAFENLKTINTGMFGSSGNIVNLDLTKLTNLEKITYRSSTALKSVNASGLKKLQNLIINSNTVLETINISGCTALTNLPCASGTGASMISGNALRFTDGAFAKTYLPALKNVIAEGLNITKISSTSTFGDTDITVTNISVANCANLTAIAMDPQQTAITMNITGTPVASDPAGITGDNGKVTFIR